MIDSQRKGQLLPIIAYEIEKYAYIHEKSSLKYHFLSHFSFLSSTFLSQGIVVNVPNNWLMTYKRQPYYETSCNCGIDGKIPTAVYPQRNHVFITTTSTFISQGIAVHVQHNWLMAYMRQQYYDTSCNCGVDAKMPKRKVLARRGKKEKAGAMGHLSKEPSSERAYASQRRGQKRPRTFTIMSEECEEDACPIPPPHFPSPRFYF